MSYHDNPHNTPFELSYSLSDKKSVFFFKFRDVLECGVFSASRSNFLTIQYFLYNLVYAKIKIWFNTCSEITGFIPKKILPGVYVYVYIFFSFFKYFFIYKVMHKNSHFSCTVSMFYACINMCFQIWIQNLAILTNFSANQSWFHF